MDYQTQIAHDIRAGILDKDDGLYLVTHHRLKEMVEIIPIHNALSATAGCDIVGIISVYQGLVDDCLITWPYSGISSQLDWYHGDKVDRDISPTMGGEVRRDGDNWTVTGITPLWTSPSRTEARRIAANTASAYHQVQVRKQGNGLALGAGSGTLLRMIGAEVGDQIMVAMFKKT